MSRPLSRIDAADPNCATCKGEGWVCENHPNRPWGVGDCCGAAGDPCDCNPLSRLSKAKTLAEAQAAHAMAEQMRRK